ncbi:MAG TPA: hypothetical protein VIQ97_04020, partial [Prevotella sp.]
AGDMELAVLIKSNASMGSAAAQGATADFVPEEVRGRLERFVQDIALLSLETEDTRVVRQHELYQSHQREVEVLFNRLLVSPQWSGNMRQFFGDMLVSPTIDATDACTMVGGIMLACLQLFDTNKFLTLVHVVTHSADEHVRQRALVGVVLLLPQEDMGIFPEVQQTVDELCGNERLRQELLEVQMQIVYCMNADADNDKIQRDIMPGLMKNNHLKFNGNGIVEREDDRMEDILDPGASDRAMEELEHSFSRMMNMQKAGSDIYFGGFSQMKRFSFFYQLSNWFTPFYAEHPGLQHVSNKLGSQKFMHMLLNKGPFCDSDKYSFALAMSTVIEKIPENMRDMLNTSEVLGPTFDEEERHSPAYMRRMYLQDLYRFFRLYHQKADFVNPFADDSTRHFFYINKVLPKPMMSSGVIELGRFLLKQGQYGRLIKLLRHYELQGSTDYYHLSAAAYMKMNDAYLAYGEYEKMLRLDADSLPALKGKARTLYLMGEYAEAEVAYEAVTAREPENRRAAMNLAVTKIYVGKVGDGMSILFRLYYDSPEDANVERALAWGHLHQGKPEQAEPSYERLLTGGKTVKEDYLNAGYARWFQSKIQEALPFFVHYMKEETEGPFAETLLNDRDLLHKYGITEAEAKIVADRTAAYKHNSETH